MLLKKWDDLPEKLKNEGVKKYYDVLSEKKCSFVIKRLFDICLSLILIVLLFPVFIVISLLIKIDSQGSIFFKQERITQYGRKFKIIKFRTMITNAESVGSLITQKNDSRITKVGNKIRSSRLDELPQLFNVLIGDMSFVGARPEVEKYVDFYSETMLATLLLPAGITSLASINYKDEDAVISEFSKLKLSIDKIYIEKVLPKKMELNLVYLLNFSIIRDIIICFQTIIKVR